MTLSELIDAAQKAMATTHSGLDSAEGGVAALLALDVPENTDQLDEADLRAFRRELAQLSRAVDRAVADADDAHEAMNAIARASGTISPQFGK